MTLWVLLAQKSLVSVSLFPTDRHLALAAQVKIPSLRAESRPRMEIWLYPWHFVLTRVWGKFLEWQHYGNTFHVDTIQCHCPQLLLIPLYTSLPLCLPLLHSSHMSRRQKRSVSKYLKGHLGQKCGFVCCGSRRWNWAPRVEVKA